jgi:lysyl-tRNA synthetase class 2
MKLLYAMFVRLGIENDPTMGKGKLIDEIFGESAKENYIQPNLLPIIG